MNILIGRKVEEYPEIAKFEKIFYNVLVDSVVIKDNHLKFEWYNYILDPKWNIFPKYSDEIDYIFLEKHNSRIIYEDIELEEDMVIYFREMNH